MRSRDPSMSPAAGFYAVGRSWRGRFASPIGLMLACVTGSLAVLLEFFLQLVVLSS